MKTKSGCIQCGYKGKKVNYILEGKEYCADCLIDILANKGIIFKVYNYEGKIEITL